MNKMKLYSIKSLLKNIALLCLISLILSCAKSSKPVEYYMLDASVGIETNQPLEKDEGPLIGLGPIRLPDYLDRFQMVVAVSENKYKLINGHRWAEKLDQNILNRQEDCFKVLANFQATKKIKPALIPDTYSKYYKLYVKETKAFKDYIEFCSEKHFKYPEKMMRKIWVDKNKKIKD